MNNNHEHFLNENDSALLNKFNWGAFLLAPVWCLTYQRITLGAISVVIISLVRGKHALTSILLLIGLGVNIFVGVTANKYLWEKFPDRYASVNELLESQRKWVPWGIIVLVFVVSMALGYFYSTL